MSTSGSKKDLLQYAIKNRLITTFDYNTFKDITLISRGGFGQVERAYAKNLQKSVALKSLHDLNKNEEFYEKFMREFINNDAINNNDNIVRFLGVSTDPSKEKYYLVFQYAEDGDLGTYLRNNFNELNWKAKINMAKDITRGLYHIHQANIVHRDLHSKNILVHEGKLMISDLGLSESLDTNSKSLLFGMVAYTDPEYLKNMMTFRRNKSSDIYSLGVLLWELSSGKPPFQGIPILETAKMVTSGLREEPIQGTPMDYINIYSSAWKVNPNQRPTAEYIHDSLENIELKNLYNNSNENSQSQSSINNNMSMDNYSKDKDIVSFSSTSFNMLNLAESLEGKQAKNDSNGGDDDSNSKDGETNNFILVSSEVIVKVDDVDYAFQNCIISSHIWAKVDPLPNKRSKLKLFININDCRAGEILSNKWPLGIGYFLDSVEIWITPIEDESMPNNSLYKVEDGPKPSNFNKEIEVLENNHDFEASIGSGVFFQYNKSKRNERALKFTTEWELLTDCSSKTGLGWKYQYFANSLFKDRNCRRSFAPGEHSCEWLTFEAMSGFRITITQVLSYKIIDGWQKYNLDIKSKLMQLSPKMAHILEISFNSLKNFNKDFENLRKSENFHEDLLNYNLGYCYHNGIGTTKDEKKAFQWYLKSAEGGSSRGQYNLGYYYHNGKDEKKAFQWYLKLSEGGNQKEKNNLGIFIIRGSCGGQFSLGNCYRDGIGTTKDEEKAFV
ncbi:hypothetical protein Glove_21g166 [Diversispora epigaea]|uniref:Protein kinase domain-containing protein n=1 Tax=Diversispora epigaea TaxID=1348612 RepID=A0A397JN80_9GLOM|nr:hypothetical protein Glove_21g166 [Diversispora epigaea]